VIEFFAKFRGRGFLIGVNNSRQRVQIPFIVR
jgi:serine protease Do